MEQSDELSIRGYRHHASAMPLPARRPVRAGGSRARAAGHYHTSVPWCARKRSFASIVPCQSSHCAMPCGSSPATRRNFSSSPFLRRYVARSGVILERIVELTGRQSQLPGHLQGCGSPRTKTGYRTHCVAPVARFHAPPALGSTIQTRQGTWTRKPHGAADRRARTPNVRRHDRQRCQVAIQRFLYQLTQRIIYFDEYPIAIPCVKIGANGTHRQKIRRKQTPVVGGNVWRARVDDRTEIDVGRAPVL